MNKKLIFLSVALVLPIGIFIFLKSFGKNQFDIPVYYAEGVDVKTSCKISYPVPYLLPDSALLLAHWNEHVMATVFITGITEKESGLNHLREDFNAKDLKIIPLRSDSLSLQEERLARLRDCVLLIEKPYNAVLVDGQKRVRGYYNLLERDELEPPEC